MIWCLIVILFLYSFFNQLMMGILGFIIVFMAISYLRPSEEWGKLLFYTRRTFEEKICMAICIGHILYTMLDAAKNGWNDSALYMGNSTGMAWVAWVKAIMMLVFLVLASLPERVFENGFRDGIRFESWDCLESIEFQKNGRVTITLKKPTLHRTVYLNLKPGDELPEAALKRGQGV